MRDVTHFRSTKMETLHDVSKSLASLANGLPIDYIPTVFWIHKGQEVVSRKKHSKDDFLSTWKTFGDKANYSAAALIVRRTLLSGPNSKNSESVLREFISLVDLPCPSPLILSSAPWFSFSCGVSRPDSYPEAARESTSRNAFAKESLSIYVTALVPESPLLLQDTNDGCVLPIMSRPKPSSGISGGPGSGPDTGVSVPRQGAAVWEANPAETSNGAISSPRAQPSSGPSVAKTQGELVASQPDVQGPSPSSSLPGLLTSPPPPPPPPPYTSASSVRRTSLPIYNGPDTPPIILFELKNVLVSDAKYRAGLGLKQLKGLRTYFRIGVFSSDTESCVRHILKTHFDCALAVDNSEESASCYRLLGDIFDSELIFSRQHTVPASSVPAAGQSLPLAPDKKVKSLSPLFTRPDRVIIVDCKKDRIAPAALGNLLLLPYNASTFASFVPAPGAKLKGPLGLTVLLQLRGRAKAWDAPKFPFPVPYSCPGGDMNLKKLLLQVNNILKKEYPKEFGEKPIYIYQAISTEIAQQPQPDPSQSEIFQQEDTEW